MNPNYIFEIHPEPIKATHEKNINASCSPGNILASDIYLDISILGTEPRGV